MSKGDSHIEVVEIGPERVEIRILSVHHVFAYDGNAIRITSKFKPDAQVYDPEELRVPPGLLNKACGQAAAILKKRYQKQSLSHRQKAKDAESRQKELPFLH